MKKQTEYISRTQSLISNSSNLEHLHTFKDFPVFMGCVDTPAEDDIVADMVWNIDRDSGMIQLGKLLPLEILYMDQHNDGTGKVWKDLYQATADFIFKHKKGNKVLEIGGAHDEVATRYLAHDPSAEWTIIEPNPQHIQNPKVKIIKDWFDERFVTDQEVDMVVHSHVFEHTYDPMLFFRHVASFLKVGQRHIFAFPNLQPMLERKFTNALNFEHTAFLTEYFTDWMLGQCGFKIIAKEYYGAPHSILYATEKADVAMVTAVENKYDEYKKIFLEFVQYHESLVAELNAAIAASREPIYIFGAHIFSIYLLKFGLNESKLIAALDNSAMKQGKRLYGTNLMVESPKVLSGKGKVHVILKAGIYNEEIKKDILENINPGVVFW